MASQDLYSNIKTVSALVPAVRNTDTSSSAIDTQGYESVQVSVHLGDSADTLNDTNTIQLKLQHSDTTTSGDFTAVEEADVIGPEIASGGVFATINAAAEDQAIFNVGYRGTKRYLRAVIDFSGTHGTGTPCSVVGILGGAHIAPTA